MRMRRRRCFSGISKCVLSGEFCELGESLCDLCGEEPLTAKHAKNGRKEPPPRTPGLREVREEIYADKSVRATQPLTRFSSADDRFPGFAVGGAPTLGFAFVPELLAFSQGKLNLYATVLEIHAGRDQGQAALLGFADELANFFAVHEQLTGPQRRMIKDVAMLVGSDMAVQEPELAIFNEPIGIFEVGASGPHGLDFGPGESHARFKFFQQEVVVRSDPIYSGIPLPGRSRIAAGIFLRVGPGWTGGGTRHGDSLSHRQ